MFDTRQRVMNTTYGQGAGKCYPTDAGSWYSMNIVMETTNLLDLVTGGLALAILIGGLVMLFSGMSGFGDKDK